MRQLRHHEQKLLKKVDFLRWKNEHNLRELQVRVVGQFAAGASARMSCIQQCPSCSNGLTTHTPGGDVLGGQAM